MKYEGGFGALNLPAVCERGRMLMRQKQTNGVSGGDREAERQRGEWQKAGEVMGVVRKR